MDAFMAIAERLGIPFAILVAVGIALWRIAKWSGTNVIMPITKSHIELIGKAKETNETNALTLAKMAETSEVTGQAIVRIADQHEESLNLTRAIHRQIVKAENTGIRAENTGIRAENEAIRVEHVQTLAKQGDQK